MTEEVAPVAAFKIVTVTFLTPNPCEFVTRPLTVDIAAVGASGALVNVQVINSPASARIFARRFSKSTVVFCDVGKPFDVSTHETDSSTQPAT